MLNLLIIISPISEEKKYLSLLEKYKVKFKALTHGIGTASKSLMNYFGINETEKIIRAPGSRRRSSGPGRRMSGLPLRLRSSLLRGASRRPGRWL